MSDYTNVKSRIAAAKAIGKGERLTDEVTEAIVAALPEGFDPKARGAVSGFVVNWLDPEGKEQQKRGPKGAQVTLDFGRGVDRLTRSVKAALAGDKPETDWIRLVRQAAENAASKGHKTQDEIVAAVLDALNAETDGE